MAWTKEDKFILKLLFEPGKITPPRSHQKNETMVPEHDLDWASLVEKAQQEGVSAALFYNITKHHLEDLVPRRLYENLANRYHANIKRNIVISAKLRDVLASLQEAGIPCIVLKGIVLAELVYPSTGMRGMSDVDILVRKEDLFTVDGHLCSHGYAPADSIATKAIHNPVGYLASLEYRRENSPLNLHVHWHTVNTSVPATAFVESVDMNRLWERATEATLADSRTLMLHPEHMIIYLCEHALRVGHSFDRLILICDLFFSIRAFEKIIDWNSVEAESRRLGLSRFVYYGLFIVDHYTSLGIPDDCLKRLRPSDISRGERFFVSLQLNNRRMSGSSYFIYLAMNRGLFAKIGFIKRTFFPPAQIILQRCYRKDAEFSKFLYFSRVGEIISHVWRSLVKPNEN